MTGQGRTAYRRALVVDDSEPVRTLIARVLTSAGYRVDVADSVATASALAVRAAQAAESGGGQRYDVAVVDLNLAGERGYELVTTLRARGDDLHRRCLFLTGGATDDLPDNAAVLVKPFLAEELVDAARQFGGGSDRPEPDVW